MKIAKYTTNIKDISLYDFIIMQERKEYKRLLVRGFYTKKNALKAWEIILDQFNDMIGGNSKNHVLALVKYVVYMDGKIKLILFCLSSLQKGYNKDLVKIINSLGIKKTFSRIRLNECINVAYSELKRMRQSLEDKQKELHLLSTEKGFEFERVLIDISAIQGYHINSKEISVFEFCELVARAKEISKKQKEKKQ